MSSSMYFAGKTTTSPSPVSMRNGVSLYYIYGTVLAEPRYNHSSGSCTTHPFIAPVDHRRSFGVVKKPVEDIRQVGIVLDIRDLLERWMALLTQQDIHKHRCQKRPYSDTGHRKFLEEQGTEMVLFRDSEGIKAFVVR